MVEERKYETLFIVDSRLEEEGRNETISRIKNLIEEHASLDGIDEWGNRKLAYEVNDQTEGYYVLADFKANPEFPLELERIFKITDGVIKFLIVNKEK